MDDANKAMSLTSSMGPYISRAKAYLGLGQVKQALADCNKAISGDKNPQSFYTRAQVWIELGDYQNAVKDCTTAIEMYPNGAVYYKTRAAAYAKLGLTSSSLKDLEKAKSLASIEN
jgi:tetratricopeptide (TPR) repeat protein